MKTPISLVVLAALSISAAVTGCQSKDKTAAAAAERKSFRGGPMPANVGSLISQRVQESKARAANNQQPTH
jgi:hypothetical protein